LSSFLRGRFLGSRFLGGRFLGGRFKFLFHFLHALLVYFVRRLMVFNVFRMCDCPLSEIAGFHFNTLQFVVSVSADAL
jgi:hypothetical protein